MRYQPLILVLVVTALVFAQVVSYDFLSWDDDVFLYQNPNLTPPDTQSLARVWTTPYAHLYAPVTYTAWWLLAKTFGQPGPQSTWLVNPSVYHLASLLVHLLAIIVAYLLLMALVREPWAAAAGAMLFAIHPLQVEPVAWSSELKDLLGGLCGLLAVLLVVMGRQGKLRPLMATGAATLLFVLALLSKPNLVILPLLVLVIDLGLLRTPLKTTLRLVIPWLFLAGAHAWFTRQAQPPDPALVLPMWQRLFVAGDSLAFYLAKLFIPIRLSADYGRIPTIVATHWWGYVTWLGPAALLAGVLVLRRKSRWALPGLLWFGLALLPVLGLVTFDFQQYSTVADHYAYLALFGPALALAGLALHARNSLACLPMIMLLVLLIAQSGLQTMSWQNNVVFWRHTLEVNPRSFLAHNNLGATYQLLHRLPEAVAEFKQALQLHPRDPDTLINLGMLLVQMGDEKQGKQYLQEGLGVRPDDPKAHLMLGIIAAEEHDFLTAVNHLMIPVGAAPDNPAPRLALAQALIGLGDKQQARQQLEEILRRVPNYTPARKALEKLAQ